jgi:hypothetical protein
MGLSIALYLAPEGQPPAQVAAELAGFELSLEAVRPPRAA